MPRLFQAADAASLKAQRSYLSATRIRLVVLTVAALLGIFSWRVGVGRIDVWGVVGVIAFMIASSAELATWRTRPDKGWYDGRAVAESSKTLTWKFAVGALPFPISLGMNDARRALVERFDAIAQQFPDVELEVSTAPVISPWMIEQRQSSLIDRRATYLKARINDQKVWYSSKASLNKARAKKARIILLTLEVLGAVLSLMVAINESVTVAAPAVAAIVVAILAWTETKQYDFNARAYSAALNDLANAEEKLIAANTEDQWAKEVDDAEEAISREHVVWRATRSRL